MNADSKYHDEYCSYIFHKVEPSTKTKKAVFSIIADLKDRRGIKHGFNQIDGDIQDEIIETWMNKIDHSLSKYNKKYTDYRKAKSIVEEYEKRKIIRKYIIIKDWIRKFRIRKFSIHIVSGSFTEKDMYNAYNAGKNWMRGHIDASNENKYSGAKITNKEPSFNDWIKNYR